MKPLKISDTITIKAHPDTVSIHYGEDQVIIRHGDELENLLMVLLILSNNKTYNLPFNDNDFVGYLR